MNKPSSSRRLRNNIKDINKENESKNELPIAIITSNINNIGVDDRIDVEEVISVLDNELWFNIIDKKGSTGG